MAIFILTVLLFPTVKVLNFYQNQAEITDLHCVNKDKPELHCAGHCYLKTQLQLEESQSPAEKNDLTSYIYLPIAFNRLPKSIQAPFLARQEVKSLSFLLVRDVHHYINAIFIPPRYLS
ncbi:hypothetical protein [Putridiphycobacter roseus]|nr:hypothetical protein [Putridiphycobacter roseus]